MHITRFLSLTDAQFQGCMAAFVDSLFGELNAAAMYLRKLENQPKGSAFAYEMSLDSHRYGALLILDRWATLVHAFDRESVTSTSAKVQTAENILGRANALIDAAEQYTPEVISACLMAYQSMHVTFEAERKAAEQSASLGPMLPEDYRQARRVFLEDLAAR